jgi:shikimate dehydrogenase
MGINGLTKLYGIIGCPVNHSLSPQFQTHYLQQCGFNAVYLPFAVEPRLLEQALDGLWAVGVEGFNVTVPYKESVFRIIEPDADAQLIGAVNTVRRGEKGWHGTNTDWSGILAVIEGLAVEVEGKDVLLFGAGGTAHAALHALSQTGLKKVYICNRNADRLEAFVLFAQHSYPDLACEAVIWQQHQVTEISQHAALLINSTSIGLQDGQDFPFALSGNGAAIDAVYRADGRTAFCRAASAAGRYAVDGLPMLIAQGAASFAWWHGCGRPDYHLALQWMEHQLGRISERLPGWVAEA